MTVETHESIRVIPNRVFGSLLFVGFLIRVFLLPTSGFQNDVSLWQNWTLKIRELGFSRVYDPIWELPQTGVLLGEVNHPPINLYYVAFLAGLPFQAPYLHPLFNFLIKFPGLAFDGLTLIILFAFCQRFFLPFGVAQFILLLYWLNPALIFHSSFWGLNESVSGFVALAVLFLLVTGRYKHGVALSIVSLAIKLQNIIFLPLVLLYVFLVKRSLFSAMKGIFLGACVFLFLYTPFFIAGNFPQAFDVLARSVGFYPTLTKGALNVWYLIDAGTKFSVLDTLKLIGPVTPRIIGIFLFGVATVVNAYLLLRSKVHTRTLLMSFALQGFSFFMLPTEMHERYIFYMFPFLPLLVWRSKMLYGWYGAVSFTYLANLILIYNYFHLGWKRESLFHYFIVALNIVCYGYLWYRYIKESAQPRILKPSATQL